MLSIGKLGVGHHAYYERSVASGADDYYTGAGEARGWYLGTGSATLGLDGEVRPGDLNHLFRGTHPLTHEQWVKRQQALKKAPTIRLASGRVIEGDAPVPTAAFDLTFSAPKSVSVLWGLSQGPVQRDIRDAHEAAVRAAFDYLERTACVTRRGRNGVRHLRGEGFVATAFHHRVSRAGDPQLHTHVLVANATRAEGRYTALHGALLYREAKTAGMLYHAALRAQLTHRLGVAWEIDPASPFPEISGVSRELRSMFSKRSEQIQQQLDASGQSGKRAANAAAIDTRAAKQHVRDGENLHERWINEARTINAPDVLHAIGRVSAAYPYLAHTAELVRAAAVEAFASTGLTANQTTFHRRDIIQLATQQLPAGASVREVEQLADAILDHARHDILQLRSEATPVPESDAHRADGTPLTDHRDTTAYTTRELLQHELAIIDSAHTRADEATAVAQQRDAERVIADRAAHRALSDEQRRMVLRLTTSGAGVELVVGLAGAGKTYSLDAAHDAWQRAGIPVRGTATALTAAKTLEAETRIPSETIMMLRTWHTRAAETGDTRQIDDAIPRRGVLIVDEAGMTETRDLAFLTKLAAERETKLVLVGDHRQLPEIGAGGTFRHLVHTLPDERVTHLTTNRRQIQAWERSALSELRTGSVEHAVAAYASQNRIVTHSTPEQLREQLAADWLDARERGRDTAMIAYTRADVEHLNHTARRLLNERGYLGPERITIAGREWAVGDELITTKNQRSLGITNGTRGRIERLLTDGLEIRTTSGELRHIPRDYLERGHAAHAYATTGHKTQGMTINGEAFVLATDHVSREWMYVTLSRATDQSRIYIDTLTHDPRTGQPRTPQQQRDAAILDIYDLALRSGAQSLAREHGRPIEPHYLDRNDLRRAMNRDALLTQRAHDTAATPARKRGIARVIEPPQRGFGRER